MCVLLQISFGQVTTSTATLTTTAKKDKSSHRMLLSNSNVQKNSFTAKTKQIKFFSIKVSPIASYYECRHVFIYYFASLYYYMFTNTMFLVRLGSRSYPAKDEILYLYLNLSLITWPYLLRTPFITGNQSNEQNRDRDKSNIKTPLND